MMCSLAAQTLSGEMIIVSCTDLRERVKNFLNGSVKFLELFDDLIPTKMTGRWNNGQSDFNCYGGMTCEYQVKVKS